MLARPIAPALLAFAVLAGHANLPTAGAALYRVGDIVEDFALVDRATGQPRRLSDFSGRIVVLDWFAWWCPFCQAAAPQLRSGIKDHYAARSGNPAGIPVIHVGVNLQSGQEAQTQNFVERAAFEIVLQDFSRSVANRIANGGQPLFAIVNGVTNSPSHRPWELLYSRQGYGQTSFPVVDFRAAIDAVQAPVPRQPQPARLSEPARGPDGSLTFLFLGEAGRTYRIEATSNLLTWVARVEITASGELQTVAIAVEPTLPALFVRAVAL